MVLRDETTTVHDLLRQRVHEGKLQPDDEDPLWFDDEATDRVEEVEVSRRVRPPGVNVDVDVVLDQEEIGHGAPDVVLVQRHLSVACALFTSYVRSRRSLLRHACVMTSRF